MEHLVVHIQLKLRGKNSRKMWGLELLIWVIQNKNWSDGCGWYVPRRDSRERRRSKTDTWGKSPFSVWGERKEHIKEISVDLGVQLHPFVSGLLPVLHSWHHKEPSPCNLCVITVSALKWSSWPFLHSNSFLFPPVYLHNLPSYLWSHLIPWKQCAQHCFSNLNFVLFSLVSVWTLCLTTLSPANLRAITSPHLGLPVWVQGLVSGTPTKFPWHCE